MSNDDEYYNIDWSKWTAMWKTIGNSALVLYNHVRATLAAVLPRGWRLLFSYGMGFMLVWAFKVAFIDAMAAQYAMPEYYYTALNIAFVTMLGALGLRGAEKAFEKYINSTNLRGSITNAHNPGL